jgi:sugar lactone lactonase YvrE
MSIRPLPIEPSVLGESPLWHPQEQVLYWCDIPGRRLNRYDPAAQQHRDWAFDTDVACCSPHAGGGLLLALRDGLWHFDPAADARTKLVAAPYDARVERFNDGKADAGGRLWVGTIYEPRDTASAALYRWAGGRLESVAGDITVSNGLAWSPDNTAMYWADTKAHTIYACDFDAAHGLPSNRRVFARFPVRAPNAPLDRYGGRPDGAAVDAEGCYWIAMFEGARVLRLSPRGELLRTIHLPVRCPTMPCFGGPDLRTLYITTARENRPADELAAMPWSGRVLTLRVDVPGLPANFAR